MAHFANDIDKILLILFYVHCPMDNSKYTSSKRCTILLREDVYQHLRTKGKFGESFSDLVNRLLGKLEKLEGQGSSS
jgi:hypothetical protein